MNKANRVKSLTLPYFHDIIEVYILWRNEMTKVTEHGNVAIVDDVTTEALEHEMTFDDWSVVRSVENRIVKKDIDFTIGDTFEISPQHTDNEPLAFSAVSGQWYGYMMDRFNCKEAKHHLSDVTNLSENLLFVSDSFDMTELEKPWARINKGQNLDIDSDLYAEEFSVETLDSSFTHAGLNNGEANIHPHFNDNGQLDAILLDFEQKYEYHAGFYQYDVISVSDKEYSVGGLYELTSDTLSAHMANAKSVIVRDNVTGYFNTLSKDTSLDVFIQEFKEQSKEYTHGNTHIYLVPVESKKPKRVDDTQVNHLSHDIVIMNDLDDPRLWGHLYDDGTIVVNWIHDGYTNIYHKLDDAIYVGEQPNGLSARENAHIADLIAQKIGQPEKEFIHPFNYAMVYQTEKGDQRTNWVQSKKIRTNEQAIAHAEQIIEKWRKGDDKSNIKMLSITKDYGDISELKMVRRLNLNQKLFWIILF